MTLPEQKVPRSNGGVIILPETRRDASPIVMVTDILCHVFNFDTIDNSILHHDHHDHPGIYYEPDMITEYFE